MRNYRPIFNWRRPVFAFNWVEINESDFKRGELSDKLLDFHQNLTHELSVRVKW